MSTKRNNHGQKAKVLEVKKSKGLGDHVVGGFVLHPTKGWRKIRKVYDFYTLYHLFKNGGFAE